MAQMPPTAKSPGDITDVGQVVLEDIRRIERQIKDDTLAVEDIPDVLRPAHLKCLSQRTLERLSHSLDVEEVVPFKESLSRDYRGITQWLGFEGYQEYIKHLSKSGGFKTKELIEKWIGSVEDPRPTVENLRLCLREEGMRGIDRPDVLTELASEICTDSINWLITKYEAESSIVYHRTEDTSWQLTRHDVVSGRKTFYTACLVYADEDEPTAQMISKLYQSVYKEALFFLPQFDLKRGKYIYDTTASVIVERCGGKVIFILSRYFLASPVCRFTARFSVAMAEEGKRGKALLIPFLLERSEENIPLVLKGLTGIRWFRETARKRFWCSLADSLFRDERNGMTVLNEIKDKINNLLDSESDSSSYYLSDQCYDEDTPPPGEPLPVDDIKLPEPPVSTRVDNMKGCIHASRLSKFKCSLSRKLKPNTPCSRHLHIRNEDSCSRRSLSVENISQSQDLLQHEKKVQPEVDPTIMEILNFGKLPKSS